MGNKKIGIFIFILLAFVQVNAASFRETPWSESSGELHQYNVPQVENESNDPVSPPPPVETEYRLHVGDVLLIGLYGEPNTTSQVYVDQRGVITYLFLKSIPAVGKTIRQLREDLQERLKTYFKHAILSITPITFSAEYYSIAGEVLYPGRKVIVGKPTLLSAISQAGGMTLLDFRDQYFDGGDLDHAFLARNGQYIPVNFERLIKQGDLREDVPLIAGDYIYIPNAQIKQVFVLGEVNYPTTINYMRTMSLAEALAEAGDVTYIASNRALVLRGSLACPLRFLVDYTRIVKGHTSDFLLQPGDIVYVPPRKFQFLREIFFAALSNFVSTVAATAGVDAFIRLQPNAAGQENIFFGGTGPIIIPTTTTSTTTTTP